MNRVYDYIEKVKRSNNRTSIINTQSNSNPPANNTAKVLIFKPQPELKPIFLVKDCLLLEFTTWGKNFISYMKSLPLPLPEGSINENLRVNMSRVKRGLLPQSHGAMWFCGSVVQGSKFNNCPTVIFFTNFSGFFTLFQLPPLPHLKITLKTW